MIYTLHSMGSQLRPFLRYHHSCKTSISLSLYILISPTPSTHHGQPWVRADRMQPKLQKDSCVCPAANACAEPGTDAQRSRRDQWGG